APAFDDYVLRLRRLRRARGRAAGAVRNRRRHAPVRSAVHAGRGPAAGGKRGLRHEVGQRRAPRHAQDETHRVRALRRNGGLPRPRLRGRSPDLARARRCRHDRESFPAADRPGAAQGPPREPAAQGSLRRRDFAPRGANRDREKLVDRIQEAIRGGQMNKIRAALAGKKSYLLAIATAGYALGYQDFDGMEKFLIGSGAIASLRAGITNTLRANVGELLEAEPIESPSEKNG